jgi:uncharacterized protein YegP (UPF0339 family)
LYLTQDIMRKVNSLITALVLSISTITAVGCATSGDEDDLSDVDGEAASAGKLTFWQASDGQWHFNLKSGNGAILQTSEAYTSRTGAINGALSVLENGVDKAQYEVASTKTGYVVHVKAANGETVAFSEVYSTKSSATRAVTSSVKAITSYLDKREANTTGARVEVTEGKSGQFHFAFFAKNGENIASSETYTTEAAAFNGAFAVQAATNYTVQQNTAGGFYFTVKASNGQIIGVSQQYTSKQSAEGGMASLKKVASTITVL